MKKEQHKDLVTFVKKKLWTFGYQCRETVDFDLGYDLLTGAGQRIKVGDVAPKQFTNKYDVFALVDKGHILYLKKASIAEYKSPYDVIIGRIQKPTQNAKVTKK
jgi:hypothetical protein